MPHPLGDELTELHVHLGGSVDPAALWGIAHEQGIRLPTKDYWEFVDLITVGKRERKSFEAFLALYRWTELIQSSPIAVKQSVYEVRSEEHTSELQSLTNLVCRLLLEKKKKVNNMTISDGDQRQ